MTETEIDQMLTAYFMTHETITRREFQTLCTQVKSTAQRLLKKLLENAKNEKI